MKWSDGEPLTAEDVAYTINRSRDEEWLNHYATTQNLTAKATSPTTLEVNSKVADPKLPTLDVYVVPKHVFEQYDAKAVTKWNGQTDVGGGPFTLTEFKKGQFARFAANPNFYKGQPAVDEVVIRVFNNADAMVAALQSGEVDFVQDVPETQFLNLEKDDKLETLEGRQGSFDELAINGGDGLKKGHPALDDPRCARRSGTRSTSRRSSTACCAGSASRPTRSARRPTPPGSPEIPEDQRLDFDLDRANQILDEAGYEDTDGDGVREMPGGGEPLRLRYAVRSETALAQPIAEFITGWLDQIGIATTQKVYDDGQLTEVIGSGDYDLFVWGWTPFVDPDTMLSYFTCGNVSQDPDDPTNYCNDANLCDPEYDKLYEEQKVELDQDKRMDIVHGCSPSSTRTHVYFPLYYYADLQAYRKDKFEGWQRQPAETGPVLFSNTSPSYMSLKPAVGDRRTPRRAAVTTAAAGARHHHRRIVAVARRGIGVLWALDAPPHRRRARVSPRYVTTKLLGSLATLAFVVVFNFFLFRVVATDPVANLFRGRNLTEAQRDELIARVRARRHACWISSGRTSSRR